MAENLMTDGRVRPERTWEEVAEEFNRRNPGVRPMTRSSAYMTAERAMRKIRASAADQLAALESFL